MAKSSLACRGLTKTYNTEEGALTAIKDVNLEIPEETFSSVIGPSGCGTSTLLKMLGGILKPTEGIIHIGKDDFEGGIPSKALLEVGFVFQSPNLLHWRTIRGNLELPLEMFGLSKKKYRDRLDRLLDMVGLLDYAKSYPDELSGGMQQRIAMIRGLVHDPDILLMDEPTSSLDPIATSKIEELIFELKKKYTVVIVTHNEELAGMADRSLEILDGMIVNVIKDKS